MERNGNIRQTDHNPHIDIVVDDLSGPEVAALIGEHLRGMLENTPQESVHALDLSRLKQPDVTFWTAWQDGQLLGCGAVKELDAAHGEIKSMRTDARHLRKGVGRSLLAHIIEEAKARGYRRLSLETGSMESFAPARTLYESFGFSYCGPFGDYTLDPYSSYMTKEIG